MGKLGSASDTFKTISMSPGYRDSLIPSNCWHFLMKDGVHFGLGDFAVYGPIRPGFIDHGP